jgi:nucleoside-diphosphate-sugar epimerase
MSSILITGASGFVGRRLTAALKEKGHSIEEFSAEQGDIARGELPTVRVDQVFHLAAKTFVPDSWKYPREFYDVNVLGTVKVLDYCRNHGATLTLISSYVYGRPDCLPIAEDHPLRAANPYGQTKVLAEELCRFYELSFRIPITIIRPFNLYGPGQPEHFLIPTLIAQALSPDATEIVVNDESPRRDYIFVSDLIDLLTRVADDPRPGAYNAGSGCSYSVTEIVAMINGLVSVPKRLRTRGEERPNEIADVVADIRKARDTFGWEPSVSMREGLLRMISQTAGGSQRLR